MAQSMTQSLGEQGVEVCGNATEAARLGAQICARHIAAAVAGRGVACIALSGGHTPQTMLQLLGQQDLPWNSVHVFQVDERVCPMESRDRNFGIIAANLAPGHLHPMPVDDTDGGPARYAIELARFGGSPPVLDLVHLGLGADGHTASLVPGDPVLDVADRDVAWTAPYQGYRRMTLTYPTLDRARFAFFLVTGVEKRAALAGLLAADAALPASHIRTRHKQIIADTAAASLQRA